VEGQKPQPAALGDTDMSDPMTDSGTAMDEGWFGYAAGIDTSGSFMHLPPKERTAAKERKRAREERWRRGREVRTTWTEQRFEQEAREIAEQIADWERARDAA